MARGCRATGETQGGRHPAGDAAGGDRRGRRSAALLVVRPDTYDGLDDLSLGLRVADPVASLTERARLLSVWQRARWSRRVTGRAGSGAGR